MCHPLPVYVLLCLLAQCLLKLIPRLLNRLSCFLARKILNQNPIWLLCHLFLLFQILRILFHLFSWLLLLLIFWLLVHLNLWLTLFFLLGHFPLAFTPLKGSAAQIFRGRQLVEKRRFFVWTKLFSEHEIQVKPLWERVTVLVSSQIVPLSERDVARYKLVSQDEEVSSLHQSVRTFQVSVVELTFEYGTSCYKVTARSLEIAPLQACPSIVASGLSQF